MYWASYHGYILVQYLRMLILIMESFSSCQETGKVFSSEMPFYSALHFNNNAYSGKLLCPPKGGHIVFVCVNARREA